MITINVKPAPGLDPAAAKVLKSDTGVGLLDAAGNVPEAGMPWPNGGLTLRLLTEGIILRADDPAFAEPDEDDEPAPGSSSQGDALKTGPTVQPPVPVASAPVTPSPKASPDAPAAAAK